MPRGCRRAFSRAAPVRRSLRGAWVDGDEGTHWGVGPGNKEKCEDCCYTRNGGETGEISLVP